MIIGLYGSLIHDLKGEGSTTFTDLKNVRIESKKNAFSMNHFGQIFHFFIGCYFSKFLDGIQEKAPKHQTR